MKLIYSKQSLDDLGPSIFLAGPTPRSSDVKSWRPDALKLFEKNNVDCTILIPEDLDGWKHTYLDQVEWEDEALKKASVILFWMPRDLKTMPAFTSNVEFGRFVESGKVVLAYPKWASKMKYLDWLAQKNNIPVFYDLEESISYCINLLK